VLVDAELGVFRHVAVGHSHGRRDDDLEVLAALAAGLCERGIEQ